MANKKKKGKFKAKVKKVAQKIKNKFRETVTRDTTRPVVNSLLKMKKGGKVKKKKYMAGGATALLGAVGQIAGDIKSIKSMKVDAKTGKMYKKGGIIQHD